MKRRAWILFAVILSLLSTAGHAQEKTPREAFVKQSNTLAHELGTAYAMGLNCNQKLQDISPSAVADLFAHYLSDSEVEEVMLSYSQGMTETTGKPCDLSRTKSLLVEAKRHLAAYMNTAEPFAR